MSSGPILIFDKSLLEALSPDEAVWLGQFYRVNMTPLFYVETLADLEKVATGDRTPERVIGRLAEKTSALIKLHTDESAALVYLKEQHPDWDTRKRREQQDTTRRLVGRVQGERKRLRNEGTLPRKVRRPPKKH